jgi:translocation and assembly module TamA
MYNTQRMLMVLLSCFFSATLFAQTKVNVVIIGVDQMLEANVRLFLSVEQQKDHALMTQGRLHRLHDKAQQEIGKALQPFGYYRPVITSELTQESPDNWRAIYRIDAGPTLPIGEFDFVISGEMQNDPELQALIDKLPLHKGDIFNHVKYEELKVGLARFASGRGYFKARFIAHRVDIDLDSYEARIQLHYDGGARYHFGEILLQQDALDDDLLRRYITFERGSPYTLGQLIDLQQALHDSNYFRLVEVSPGEPQQDGDEVPVNVTLTPRTLHRYSIGLGYGSDTGARAKFGWQIPLLNPKGHRFDTEADISQIGYTLAAHYRVPVLNPRTDQMVYSAGVVNEVTDTTESTLRTLGASLQRSRGEWRESFSVNYEQEDYIIAEESGTSELVIPSVSWSRIWGNSFIYAIDGLRFDMSLRAASDKFISDTSFSQFQSSLKAISALGPGIRVIARGSLGGTYTQSFDQLPTSIRFFTGGANSVRGYAYEALGPVDENGEVVGGRYLMVGSLELEHRLNAKWSAAVFYDAGNAIDNLADDLERGAGIGFRWKSPVGPVRFDLASAVSREGQPWRIHINIGPDL